MATRFSPADAARLGIAPVKTGKRGPAKTTVIPAAVWAAYGIPQPVAEFRFCKDRKWRLDWAWPDSKLGLECDGGVFVQGGHTRGRDIMGDHEKFNRAVCLGWRVLRCTPAGVKSGAIFGTIKEAMGAIE